MREYRITPRLDELSFMRRDFPAYQLEVGNGILMDTGLVKLFMSGKKTTIIKYAKGRIRVPCMKEVNLIEIKQDDKAYRRYMGTVSVEKIVVKKFRELTQEDALNDGFRSRDGLIKFLNDTYGRIAQGEPLAIYHIKR